MGSNRTYYTYHSLQNWQFLLDIFLNKRLCAAPFASLNDPMEGQNYYVDGRVRGIVRSAIAARSEEWNICSNYPCRYSLTNEHGLGIFRAPNIIADNFRFVVGEQTASLDGALNSGPSSFREN